MNIKNFWYDVLRQDADAIRAYFYPDAWVNWHNTNEHFTLEEFIRANCEYPNQWDGEVEWLRLVTLLFRQPMYTLKTIPFPFMSHLLFSSRKIKFSALTSTGAMMETHLSGGRI